MRKAILDAHVLLWYIAGSSKLPSQMRAILDDPDAVLLLPAIALAEACWVIAKQKAELEVQTLRDSLSRDRRIVVVSLLRDLIFRALSIEENPEMHDQPILATAAAEFENDSSAILLTSDARMRTTKIVPIIG